MFIWRSSSFAPLTSLGHRNPIAWSRLSHKDKISWRLHIPCSLKFVHVSVPQKSLNLIRDLVVSSTNRVNEASETAQCVIWGHEERAILALQDKTPSYIKWILKLLSFLGCGDVSFFKFLIVLRNQMLRYLNSYWHLIKHA